MIEFEELKLSTLGDLDDRIEILFQRHLQNIANDCLNRPAEKTKRKVVVELSFEPVADPDSGDCDSVRITIEARSKVPTFRTKSYPLGVTKAGFRFNSENPSDLRQPALPLE